LPTLLQKHAQIFYNSIPAHEKATYQGAMATMANYFSIRHQPPTTRAAKLQRKQGLTESVRDFSLEIVKRMQECQVTEPDRQLDIYMQNLREDVAKKVLLMCPSNLRHAQTCAEMVEHTMAMTTDNSIAEVGHRSRMDTYNTRQRTQKRGRDDHRRSTDRDDRRGRDDRRSTDREDRRRSGDRRRSNHRSRRGSRGEYRSNSVDRRNFRRSPTPYGNNINEVARDHSDDEHSDGHTIN